MRNKVFLALVLPFLVFALTGCNTIITNEEIVRQTKVCKEGGLDAELIVREASQMPVRVFCVPKSTVEDTIAPAGRD